VFATPQADEPIPINEVREAWLDHALSTEPADRPATEQAITELYAMVERPPPEFIWTDSPHAAAEVVGPPPAVRFEGPRNTAQRLASLVHDLRERTDRWSGGRWSTVDFGVRRVLRLIVRDGVAGTVRATMDHNLGLHWLGQHDVDWIARFDAAVRTSRVRFSPGEHAQWELWATLARSCGWWWPGDDVCVVAERPATVHTERVEPSDIGQRRLHHGDRPAIEFRDGTAVHVWHGTRVPAWVVDDPTAERITAEPNAEVRRCAIERIGWPAFIELAGLRSVARADDPGNPGRELRLYDLPYPRWGRQNRLLLMVNGSVERDGTRRRYGLHVPSWFTDPVDAAGWTYGLTGAQYGTLARRT
jgi:hypothetical protein